MGLVTNSIGDWKKGFQKTYRYVFNFFSRLSILRILKWLTIWMWEWTEIMKYERNSFLGWIFLEIFFWRFFWFLSTEFSTSFIALVFTIEHVDGSATTTIGYFVTESFSSSFYGLCDFKILGLIRILVRCTERVLRIILNFSVNFSWFDIKSPLSKHSSAHSSL